MEVKARVLAEPLLDCCVFVRSIVIHNDVDIEILRYLLLNLLDELQKFLMPVARKAPPNNCTIQNIESRE